MFLSEAECKVLMGKVGSENLLSTRITSQWDDNRNEGQLFCSSMATTPLALLLIITQWKFMSKIYPTKI